MRVLSERAGGAEKVRLQMLWEQSGQEMGRLHSVILTADSGYSRDIHRIFVHKTVDISHFSVIN